MVAALVVNIANHCELERAREQVDNHYGVGLAARSGKPACASDEPEIGSIDSCSTTRRWV